MRERLFTLLAACVCVVVLVYVTSAGCGRGGRGYFSPDTLDCRTHSEWLLPMTRVPVYRGPDSVHRYEIVDFLVRRGFWSPRHAAEPRWLSTFQWNAQWSDGQSQFHRELGWHGGRWIRWTEENPEIARLLWPRLLDALRDPDIRYIGEAEYLLSAAQFARSAEEFRELADELEARETARRAGP